MKTHRHSTLLPAIALMAATVLSVGSRTSFAEKGEVQFGATGKPDIKRSAEVQAFRHVFADVAEKVIPTVVCITATTIDTVVYQDPGQQFFGFPFDDFFGGGGQMPRGGRPQLHQQEQRKSGVGSGVIVSAEGYILTNNHVVAGADEISVRLNDDREYEATVVGRDSLSDVAVIKLKDKVDKLPVAYIGESEQLRPGDWVMAVGNPFNLNSTVTTGIVSAMGRHTSGVSLYQNFIQTDAAINPGNSGGALVDIDGALVGINTMIYTRSGGYMGIGFAIPITMAKNIAQQLISKGKVSRGWLGVSIADMDNTMRDALGLDGRKGALVSEVFADQPAAKAGVKAGDVILSINGVPTGSSNDLRNTVAGIEPGKKVPLQILRDGREQTLNLVLADRDDKDAKVALADEDKGGSDGKPVEVDLKKKLGISVGSLSDDLRSELGLDERVSGVLITALDPAGPAARKGLLKGDLIVSVKVMDGGFVAVTDPKGFKVELGKVKSGDPVVLQVRRGRNLMFVALKIN